MSPDSTVLPARNRILHISRSRRHSAGSLIERQSGHNHMALPDIGEPLSRHGLTNFGVISVAITPGGAAFRDRSGRWYHWRDSLFRPSKNLQRVARFVEDGCSAGTTAHLQTTPAEFAAAFSELSIIGHDSFPKIIPPPQLS